MIALQIEEMKDFTAKLLLRNTFDRFYLSKASITTGTTLTLDGHLNKSYYDDVDTKDEYATRTYAYWSECKELAFSRIKGKRLPLSFQFVMVANEQITAELCTRSKQYTPEQIAGLFLNIQYDGTAISCITGTSLHTFSLDKTMEQLWDQYIIEFFERNEIRTKFPTE